MTSLVDSINNVKNGTTTVEQIAKTSLDKIKKNEDLNSYIEVYSQRSIEQAISIDKKVESGKAGPLAGCIIAIKDNICIKDQKVTCGSKILENFTSPYNATVIDRLEEADALVIGKTNLDEFAMGSSNENSFFGPVKNPHDKEKVPGGSSGGSAVAVASGTVPIALGSDTGGSIRQPAAFCGIQALKPTYGRVSRFGLVAFASSLDQIGPFGRSAEDIANIIQVISGHDPNDSTSAKVEVPNFVEEIKKDTPKFKIGVPKGFLDNGVDPEIKDSIENQITNLEKNGFKIGEVELPNAKYAVETYYILANAEASSNLARYDGARYGFRTNSPEDLQEMYLNSRSEGFGEEVKRRIILGTFVLNAGYYDAYYEKAQKIRRLIYNDFMKVFENYDMIITPTTPTTAFKIGEKIDNPLEMYLNDIFTIPVNLAGLPSMVVPSGKTKEGMPIGVQLIGKHFDEVSLLQMGSYIENN